MNPKDVPPILKFDKPAANDPKTWGYAVGESFKFPDRLLQKCRELAQARQLGADLQTQLDRVVSNLISIADNCHDALAAMKADGPPKDGPPADGPPADGAPAKELEAASLASVQRSVVALLEYLEVVPVELLGKTYETVTCQGRKVPDPFEIIEAKQAGTARSLPVVEVVLPLWVRVEKNRVRVVRAGKVCC